MPKALALEVVNPSKREREYLVGSFFPSRSYPAPNLEDVDKTFMTSAEDAIVDSHNAAGLPPMFCAHACQMRELARLAGGLGGRDVVLR